ncbi:AIPR family protein [Acidithiobacillus albertensis]|uniref:AIPR family protein n=1 Tax=Acidithiobacillus albertensis TaxID=119978 RepID=UPI00094B00C4|nr:AIPR family protein [Acidithiobacillus albertensis]
MSTELGDFLRETQAEVREQTGEGSPFEALTFSEVVMQHMAEIGMTFEPVVCHFQGKIGNANLRLSGYAMSDEADQLDLFVSLYEGVDVPTPVPDAETKTAVEQCLRFLALCAEGRMAAKLDPSSDAYSLALTIREIYDGLEQVRVFVLTDRVAKAKSFKTREIAGKTVRLEVMDIERLHRHWSEGKPRDELVVDFTEVSGSPLPCVFVPGNTDEYDYALTAMPGKALRFLYERFGARLLEANVRSFLSVKGKGVNAGIQATLRNAPGRFMAYNNGIVVVADEMRLDRAADGSPGIAWVKGLQIVNGGQTTASIFFAKRKFPDMDLAKVRVPAKIIIMRVRDEAREEALVSDISRFANSQNAVRQSDLSANKPFHVDVERLSLSVYCPDGTGRWFYERAAGSYNTLLSREGTTQAKLKALKEAVPPSRKITKTDLAKYLLAWSAQPDVVSLGSQKCFDRFMSGMTVPEGEAPPPAPDVAAYKSMVAVAIVFKAVQKLVRPMFQAFQANVAAYTVSLLAARLGSRFDLERVWDRQCVSPELLAQFALWAGEVNETLHRTAGGRMVSEWAKRPECREAVLGATYSEPAEGIPEIG